MISFMKTVARCYFAGLALAALARLGGAVAKSPPAQLTNRFLTPFEPRETFIPGFLERDEAIRRPPRCYSYTGNVCTTCSVPSYWTMNRNGPSSVYSKYKAAGSPWPKYAGSADADTARSRSSNPARERTR